MFSLMAFLLFIGTLLTAQEAIPPGGGGAYQPESNSCLTDAQRVAIADMLLENEAELRRQGLIGPEDAASVVNFGWPLKAAPELAWNNFVMVSNYVDHGPGPQLLDFNCSNRTYDGHQGLDLALWPFGWHLKNNNLVHVVAAESGLIIGKQDGNPDENCTWDNQAWNAVYVRHGDGSVAWYGHLKNGSLTNKGFGSPVTKGEYLGVVASSGVSTGPHLHFEVYRQIPYQFGNLIDPYAGACNSLNPGVSWWADQQPYWNPTLNAALTHSAPMEFGCPSNQEHTNFSDHFAPGAVVYTALYFRDQQQGQQTSMRLRTPQGIIWKTWSHSSPQTYPGSYWWWSWVMPANGPFGIWTFEATSAGQTMTHPFTYGNLVSTEQTAGPTGLVLAPNPTTGAFRLLGDDGAPIDVQILDPVGRLRYADRVQANAWVAPLMLEAGAYTVRAVRHGQVQVFRLVQYF